MYDIDKAYIMGLSFDGNGKYVGWSNLFDYTDIDTIKASEYLPMPKKKVYKVTNSGVNIDSFILDIVSSQSPVERINGYVKLLNFLNDNDITEVYYTIEEGKKVMQDVNMHEFTIIPYSLREEASKNFISSHIQNTVQNLRNMIGAYSPIDMEVFRDASNESPKGEQSSKMTLLNPTTKLLMQYQNITGKNVIGIAANGEKASFMWHYYINDILRMADGEEKEKKINYATFEFSTTRIQGRSLKDESGNPTTPTPITVNTLPDVNFEGVDPQISERFGTRLTGDITVDLMISQILSAATDNAKELILAKVNAGNKLAKMYLFLVTLGFNINDIVKFMTSPVVSFIDAITETNIFTGQDLDMKEAIKLAKGDFSDFYLQYMSKRTAGRLDKDVVKSLREGKVDGLENPFSEGTKEFNEFENTIDAISEIRYLFESAINTEVESILRGNKGRSRGDVRAEIMANIPADIAEFENVFEGANEFSNLGRILGFNQGLPTSKADLQSRVQFIQSILSNREVETGTESIGPLDVRRYFVDLEYAKQVKDQYESVKKCINIFDIIDHIPQFNSIFKIFSAVMDIDHNIAIKTRAYDNIYDQLKKDGWYMSEDYQKRLLKGIDDAIIAKFISSRDIRIPYIGGTKIVNDLRQVVTLPEDGMLEFDSLSNVASFKYLFENSIIPALKRGVIYDYQGKHVQAIVDESLKENKFIQSLIRGDHRGMPLYKCDLDMLTVENSQDSKIKFQTYMKGLLELQKVKINGTSLADLFVLYNLIVNKNQYGSDRMTTLFDSFIQSNGQLSLIRDYLSYVGNLDYNETWQYLELTTLDLMRSAAAIVNSDIGQKDPTIIVNTESGPILMIKDGKGYVTWDAVQLIPKISGESQDAYLERIYNNNSYFVLGGTYKLAADNQVNEIRQLGTKALDVVNQLIRQGILTVNKVCQ